MSRGALYGKRILVGVTGGIAAYKSAELVRALIKAEADVHVCMTNAATKFITPLTLETLSKNRVRTQIFSPGEDSTIEHTEFGRHMDGAVIAPASADFLGRLANGLADQLLLCALMASEMPVLLCPSMNHLMWHNPLVQRNVKILNEIPRYHWLQPDSGELACNVEGTGRLPDTARITAALTRMLTPQDLANRRLVVTAGPTREWLDPVRFLSNPSTGKMGYALARAAWERGADVHLITGPSALDPPPEVTVSKVSTTQELLTTVSEAMKGADALLMAAAPADYAPEATEPHKIKKNGTSRTLELLRTPDILKSISAQTNGTLLLGFAAETQNHQAAAAKKAQKKSLDLIFANDVGSESPQTGFGKDTNGGTLMDGNGQIIEEIGVQSKNEVAHLILNHVVDRIS